MQENRMAEIQYLTNKYCFNHLGVRFALHWAKVSKVKHATKGESAAYLQTRLNNKIHKTRRQKSICIAVTTI